MDKSSGRRWTTEESRAIYLGWDAFHAQYPERSKEAWEHKRRDNARQYSAYLAKDAEITYLDDGRSKAIPQSKQLERLSDEELFNAVVGYGAAINKAFPHTLEHSVSVEADEPIAIAFLSDWHIGSQGTDLARIREDCQLIASHPRLYAAVGGDPVDNFILDKMGSAARSQIAQVEVQWRLFRYCISLIQDSLLWVSSGNHDAWTHRVAGIDGVPTALAGIPVVYTGEGGFITVKVGKQEYRIYRKHKPTRFGSSYNQTHFLKQMLRMGSTYEFDIGVSEHLHEANIEVMEYRPGTKVDRVFICCGSYKIRDDFAESLGYYGGGYGIPTVILYPNTRRILPFYSMSDAVAVLDGLTAQKKAA